MANPIYHALVLNLHQPHGNLAHLLAHDEWQAKEILFAMDRIPRALADAQDVGRVHLALSGTLMETLTHSEFQSRAYGIVDCGALLWQFQSNRAINVLGGAYYHPVLPLVPPADWEAQLERWRGMGRRWFFNSDFQGFWPPELGFCMEMIPLLRRFGYRFVIVDSEHVRPVGDLRWDEVRYRPHLARFGGEEITVIVRDRDLSDAQDAGMSLEWFDQEVRTRTQHCDFPALVTTCTDGENGRWFRAVNPGDNFWDAFYRPLVSSALQAVGVQRASRSKRHSTDLHPRLSGSLRRRRRGHGGARRVEYRMARWRRFRAVVRHPGAERRLDPAG